GRRAGARASQVWIATGRRAGARASQVWIATGRSMCTPGAEPHFFQASCRPAGRFLRRRASFTPSAAVRQHGDPPLPPAGRTDTGSSLLPHIRETLNPSTAIILLVDGTVFGDVPVDDEPAVDDDTGAAVSIFFPLHNGRAAAPRITDSVNLLSDIPRKTHKRQGVHREPQSRRIRDRPIDRAVPDRRFTPSGSMRIRS
ncbi:MAG: hypothetical protein PWR16_2010, partial [Methanoculleus sp.]|nr:hypothetical protein [Methanoculleus sp.]